MAVVRHLSLYQHKCPVSFQTECSESPSTLCLPRACVLLQHHAEVQQQRQPFKRWGGKQTRAGRNADRQRESRHIGALSRRGRWRFGLGRLRRGAKPPRRAARSVLGVKVAGQDFVLVAGALVRRVVPRGRLIRQLRQGRGCSAVAWQPVPASRRGGRQRQLPPQRAAGAALRQARPAGAAAGVWPRWPSAQPSTWTPECSAERVTDICSLRRQAAPAAPSGAQPRFPPQASAAPCPGQPGWRCRCAGVTAAVGGARRPSAQP